MVNAKQMPSEHRSAVVEDIERVEMLGVNGSLQYKHDDKGLTVTLPKQKPCDYFFTFKITGLGIV